MVYQWPLTKRGPIVNLLDLSIYFKTFYYSNTYYPAFSIHPSIHYAPLFSGLKGWGDLSQLASNKRQGTAWTNCQFLTGPSKI